MIFKHLSIAVDNFHNDRRFHQFAAVCKHAVCFCHIPDRHAVGKAAERRRQVRITVFTVSDQGGNPYILCRPDNLFYTHLIRQMDRLGVSRAVMIPPYHAGASKSKIMDYLEPAHYDVKLSENEKRTFACWLDLLIPFCGSYPQHNTWTEAEKAEYHYFQEKRRVYAAAELESLRQSLKTQSPGE